MTDDGPKTRKPVLSALMCDGMGWFSAIDLKRTLLMFDEVNYLIPTSTAEFEDLNGQRQLFQIGPAAYTTPGVTVRHYVPNERQRSVILAAADTDAADETFGDRV